MLILMANSQQRCVFVGNIPYDATEEQLVQICEEVGPVVKFRLVIDRDTGKPKGYGFCEYKDEETALSARRNLHGYDINGRQLRVDFAENDKNNDRSKEQGRGGPGLATNTASQNQIGGPALHGDPSIHQAVGLQDAMAAAIMISGARGGGQSQNGILSQPMPGTDPLTLHLAKMSKLQLTEVLTEVKTMATQNKEQARQLLLAHPQLSKAVLQALIMMKLVPPHLLQIPKLPGALVQPSGVQVQPLSGLPPLSQNKMPLGFVPQGQSQSQPSSTHPASLLPSQYATSSVPLQPRFQTPIPVQHQHPTLSGLPVPVSGTIQSLHSQQAVGLSNHSAQLSAPVQTSIQTHSLLQDNAFKPSSSVLPSVLNNGDKDHDKQNPLLHNPAWAHNKPNHHHHHHPNSKLHENGRFMNENDQISHPSKLLKMEDGKAASFSHPDINPSPSSSSSTQNKELPVGVDSALLQQVLNLTAEQLSSLPPDQQQQVIQLQQMLRHST